MDKNARKPLKVLIILFIVIALIVWFAVAIAVEFLTNGLPLNVLSAIKHGASDFRVWLLFVSALIAGGVAIAVREMRSGKRVMKINELEDAHWLTERDVSDSDNMTIVSFNKLEQVNDGVPIYAAKSGKTITTVLAKPIHTLIIGTTGSGKTSGFVDPTVQILCRTKSKPCMVITDPKGELYAHHAATLKAQGYNVNVLDVAEPYKSARWNPFQSVIEKTRQIKQAETEIKDLTVITQAKNKYKDVNGNVYATYEQAKAAQGKNKYAFGSKYYETFKDADDERKVYVQTLKDEIFIELQDVINTICPLNSKQDPLWEQGARNFIFSIALAMWEDLLEDICTEEEFNLHSLYQNITYYGKGEVNQLKEYLLQGRDEFSKVEGLANTVLSSQDKQLSSYLSQLNNYIVNFTDSGVRCLTSGNDIDLNNFDESPSALFIKIPDEKTNRHFIVTLLITQMYKVLVNKARQNMRCGDTPEEVLKRNVYVIMDEFGNMPKFNIIDNIITIGRSRHIFMLPIVQNYAQLDNKYGKEVAATIRNNCNIKIFIGSTDLPTVKEFSESCGKTKRQRVSISDGSNNSANVSISAESVPLIHPSELAKINDPPKKMGNAIVLAFGTNPLRAKYEPVFKARQIYNPAPPEPETERKAQVFDEQSCFYNVVRRNILNASNMEMLLAQQELVRDILNHNKSAASLMNTLDGEPLEPDEEFNPLGYAVERLYPFVVNIKKQSPKLMGNELETLFLEGNAQGVIKCCEKLFRHATSQHQRWLKTDVVKLKNIIQQIMTHKEAINEDDNYD